MTDLDAWLRSVLWDQTLPSIPAKTTTQFEIHRLKAKLPLANGEVKIVQGVREIFDILDATKQSEDCTNEDATIGSGKIVLIGRYLQGVDFEQSFLKTMGSI